MLWLAGALGVLTASPLSADVLLPSIFSDHMVLQRDQPVPVWGFAEPGEKVTVTFDDHVESATTDEAGHWRVDLPAMAAGGPFTMTVTGANTVTVKDVFIGEVWLCSGQSNMEWSVANSMNAEAEILAADRPLIRMYTAKHTLSATPLTDVKGTWQVCSPDTVGGFSAVGYYFGRELRDELKIPVGLIHSSWGGSRAEPWTPREALLSHERYAGQVKAIDEQRAAYEADKQRADAEYQEQSKAYQAAYQVWSDGVTHGGRGVAEGRASDSAEGDAWRPIRVPGVWEQAGDPELASFDGVVWFRRTVDIPEGWAGHDLTLGLGPIDDIDATFFNGEQVGHIGLDTLWHWAQQRRYTVSGAQVKAGMTMITVRVADTGGGGGFAGEPGQMSLSLAKQPDAEPIALAGEWFYRIDTPMSDFPTRPAEPVDPAGVGAQFTSPAAMYNAMLHPLVPYALRGAVWYQGESNAGEALAYQTLLALLIEGWRDAWDKPQMPFGIVQLANFTRPTDGPVESRWAELRDAQLHTFKHDEHVGLAVTIDIGEADDIHPRNKQEVGRRLALWALSQVYDKDLAWSGPIYKAMRTEGDKVFVSFDHVGGGLKTSDGGALRGFTVADEAGRFFRAGAEIVGDEVMVWNDTVPTPTAVRYGWADNPEGVNLVNETGLPASPFTTSGWVGAAQVER